MLCAHAAKITDFGLSKSSIGMASQASQSKPAGADASGGTPAYKAPEVMRAKPFTEKADVFR